MKYVNKYSVGSFIGIVVLLSGLFLVQVFEDKIIVTLPSDVCNDATLRVTKDDFTFKCGRRIAFQADTIVEYYKTYGTDEWVRNNRYVGRNKKDISLELIEYPDKFDIVRTTRYRKGKQSLLDGVLRETYTFTKDKIKISYDYVVDNKAEHKITMRIKKQYNSYLDPFDPNGYTGILGNNALSYQGKGDLFIDPSVSLVTPATGSTAYVEGETVPFICNSTTGDEVNMTLQWDALGSYVDNGTVTVAGNETVTFSRVIPHYTLNGTDQRSITWNCLGCNSSGDCAVGAANFTLNPMYAPNAINIDSPESDDLNLLNGTDWMNDITFGSYYSDYVYIIDNTTIAVNWTYQGHPDAMNISYNLSIYGTTDSTRNHSYSITSLTNSSVFGTINFSNVDVDDYHITLKACTLNGSTIIESLCVNDTATNTVEVFDYNLITPQAKLAFPTVSSINDSFPYGQTNFVGFVGFDWLGYGYPTGIINVTLNYSNSATSCLSLMADVDNNVSSYTELFNYTKVMIINASDSDPDYIWLWGNKSSCTSGTDYDFSLDIEVLD